MNPQEDMLLLPVITLALWTIFMSLWMFATRIPAITNANLGPEAGKHTADMKNALPSKVRAIGDNFSNLFEMPVIFYVIAGVIFLGGHVDMMAVYLAWGFVGFRILHSLIQSTYNNVMHRFGVYLLALLCVLAMGVRELLNLI
jgi:hypothetical protein